MQRGKDTKLIHRWRTLRGLLCRSLCSLLAMTAGVNIGWAQPSRLSGGDGGGVVIQNEQLSGQRVMHTFDFEEKDKHFNKLPMYWWKVRGREDEGFAHYSMGRLDETHHRSGGYSFRLDSDGSSVGFMYARRRIQARPGSDFAVTAWVHLEQVRSSRARISCALTDRSGRIIQESMRYSKLVSSLDHNDNGWGRLEVYMPGNYPDARYITIGVWLLQEEQWNDQARQSSAIFRRDVKAVGWFDDITIVQLPRVLLHTDKPGNVFDGDETASLRVEVEGVNSLNYQVRLVVRHASGDLVRDEIWHLSGLEGSNKGHAIELPELPAGLYRAELSILTSKRLIATRELVFCKLSKLWGAASSSGRNFGILALDETVGDWSEAVELTRLCNAKLLKIPVWRKKIGQKGSIFSEPNFDRKLIELQKKNIELVATFSEAPDFLAGMLEVDRRGVLDVLSQDASIWKPQVSIVLAQYARQIPYWQIGGDHLGGGQTWDPRIKPVAQTLLQEFNRFVSNPVLVVPLNSMYQISADQTGSDYVSLSIPTDITPRQIPSYLRDYHDNGFGHIWVTIEPMEKRFHNREQKLIDFSKRIAYALGENIEFIFINQPWGQRESNARLMTEPKEIFPVYRTLSDHLGNTEYAGEIKLGPNISALIFDRSGSGVLFAWNDHFDPDADLADSTVTLYLGQSPQQVDLFGNTSELVTQNNKTTIQITQWPVLLTNIDSSIAKLRSSLSIHPKNLNATIQSQKVTLQFTNPYHTSLSGRLRFLPSASQSHWFIDPIALNFVLGPNQKYRQDITLKFPRNEIGGPKSLLLQMNLDADQTYQIQAELPFTIGLEGVDVNYFVRKVNETDLLIQKVVTNNSDEMLSLISFVDLPDSDRLERSIGRLMPGEVTVKNFLIPNADQWIGQFIRLGLYDPKGTKRINYQIEIN